MLFSNFSFDNENVTIFESDNFQLIQALLHSVPVGRMVVLDLFAEVKPIWPTSEQFYGIPYIWKETLFLYFAFFFFLCYALIILEPEFISRVKTENFIY